MNKACFLDRDGVVNEEVDYLWQPEKAMLIPGVAAALRQLRRHGFLAIVVSNQAGVARGYYKESDVDEVNARIQELLVADGARIDAFYYCPHHPEFSGECSCRKPEPGMLLTAAADFKIDLKASFMVGDRLSDLEAAERAGCKCGYLVRTGYGSEVVRVQQPKNVKIADDLKAAVADYLAANPAHLC